MDFPELKSVIARSHRGNSLPCGCATGEEYRSGHIPGFRWFPGGQAVQRADDVAPVRCGLIVFSCDGRVRSTLVASWFRQMGFPNVYALRSGVTRWAAQSWELEEGMPSSLPFGLQEARAKTRAVLPQAAAAMSPTKKIFVGTSIEFADGHVPGARWTPRGWLEFSIGDIAPCKDEPISSPAPTALTRFLRQCPGRRGYSDVTVLEGGMNAWGSRGLEVERGLSGVMTPPNDVVVMGPHRSYADTINYLRWEEELGHKYSPRA